MAKPEDLKLDQLLYNAVLYLIQTDAAEAAELLVECELDGYQDEEYIHNEYTDDPDAMWPEPYTTVILSAPQSIQSLIGTGGFVSRYGYGRASEEEAFFEEEQKTIRWKIAQAFEAVLRRSNVVITTYLQLVASTEGDWRSHLRQLARGEKTTNQGSTFDAKASLIVWNNLNFRSKAERQIAEALDRVGVLYMPNCMARMGPPEHRHNKEPDFLVCFEGKWGILEIDGREFHQAAAQDHERDRQFRQHGIKVIERFAGQRCLQEPDEVVRIFLGILKQNG